MLTDLLWNDGLQDACLLQTGACRTRTFCRWQLRMAELRRRCLSLPWKNTLSPQVQGREGVVCEEEEETGKVSIAREKATIGKSEANSWRLWTKV